MQRVFSSQAPTPRVIPLRPSAMPTPQRLSTPTLGTTVSRRTSSPHAPTVRGTTAGATRERENSNNPLESTMTLIQKPIGPPPSTTAPASTRPTTAVTTGLSARQVQTPAKRPIREKEPSIDSSASSSSSDEEDVAARKQEEEDATRRRLHELERMMSSGVLGFARQPQSPAPKKPETLKPGQSMIALPGKPTQPQTPTYGTMQGAGDRGITAASPPRGRPVPPALARAALETGNRLTSADAPLLSPPVYGNTYVTTQHQRPTSTDTGTSTPNSRSKSIPSIPSPSDSQSPAQSTSASQSQSSSPLPGPLGHAKRLSLDGGIRGVPRMTSAGGSSGPGSTAAGHRPQHRRGPRTASAHGSSASSFSDLSGASMSPRACGERSVS